MADIDFANRIKELESAQHRSDLTTRVNLALSRAVDEQEILGAIELLSNFVGIGIITLAYIDTPSNEEIQEARVVAMRTGGESVDFTEFLPTDIYPLDANPVLRMALKKPDEPLFIENVFTDPRTEDSQTREAFKHTGYTSTIILWFKIGGTFQGVMTFSWQDEVQINDDIREVFKTIQPVAAAIIANRRLMLKLEKNAEISNQEATLFKRLVDHSVDSIVMADRTSHTILYANQAAYDTFGYDFSEEEMLNQNLSDLWYEEEQGLIQQEFLPKMLDSGWVGEMRHQQKSGTIFDMSVTYFVIDRGEDSRNLCFIGRDITEQKQVEEEKKQLQQKIIDAQNAALSELSTPIIPVMENIIVMPLIGAIDTLRARDITRSLLSGVTEYRAKVVIMDITGVHIVDSGVADHLNRTIQAARLKGAKIIMTGISDNVAETVVDLGIDWGDLQTLPDLQSGLITALGWLNIRLEY